MAGLCAIALLVLSVASVLCVAEPVKVAPHKIVLNARGADGIQVIVSMVLPCGTAIGDYQVDLWLGDVLAAQATSLRYCVVDDNLLVGFDRAELQSNPDVVALAGQTVTAFVEGWLISCEGPDAVRVEFSGTDQVEIVAPGKK